MTVWGPLDLSHWEGIAFYWWGSGGSDQNIDFEMRSPTGGWVGTFPDGPAMWRWVFLRWSDLTAVDFDGSRPDRSNITHILWTYHTDGVRRINYIVGWRKQDVYCHAIIRNAGSGELFAKFEVGQGFNDLFARFEVMVDRFTLIEEQILTSNAGRVTFTGLDLNAHKNYTLIAEWYNPFSILGLIWFFYNGDEVKTNYHSQAFQAAGTTEQATKYNEPRIGIGDDLESNMAVVHIGISPGGYINALSQSRAGKGTYLMLHSHAQSHTVVQANLTQLTISCRNSVGLAEYAGFGTGSKFRLYGYKS